MAKNYKLLIWHVVVAGLVWKLWSYGQYVTQRFPVNIGGIDFEGTAIINFIVLITVLALGIVLFESKLWTVTLTVIIALFYLLQFGFTQLSLLGVLMLFLWSLMARASGLTEVKERTKIDMQKILRSAAYWLVIAFFILVSFAVYQSPNVQSLKNTDQLPSESQKFIRIIVEKAIGSRLDSATEKQKQTVIGQATSEVTQQINTFLKPYFKYSPPLLAFGLFLVLWGLSWLFVWLSVWLGMLIFFILKKSRFVKIEEKDVKAETIII